MYSSTVIVRLATLFLILTHVYFFFPMASLQGGILYLMCVFLKKKNDDYICVLLVPLSGSVGWTCLSAAIFRPGFLLALLLVMMTQTLPSSLEGHFTNYD